MKLSRRLVLQVLPASLPLAAQAPAPAEPTPDLDAARLALQASVRAVRQVNLPMWVEPATKFAPRG
jgi:hypothetical protein